MVVFPLLFGLAFHLVYMACNKSTKQTAPPPLPQNFLLEGFEDTTGWILGGTGASHDNDTIHYREGKQSIKLTATNGGEAYAAKNASIDLSSMTNIIFWVYISDLSKLSSIRIIFNTQEDWSKYFHKTISHGSEWWTTAFKPGWNRFVIAKAAFDNYGSASWSDTIIAIQIKCIAASGEDVSVSFDDLRRDYEARAKCILTFDDGHESVYNKAKPIMDGNGQAGVAFVITNYVGYNEDYMTKTELEILRDAGWDISNHTCCHDDLTTLSQEQMEAHIGSGYDWLVDNGFSESASFFCYPLGAYNDAIITKVKERHTLARSVIMGNFEPHFQLKDDNIDYLIKRRGVASTEIPAQVKPWIDEVIDTGGLLVLMFHRIVDSGASGGCEYLTEDFEEISDYLKSRNSKIDVVTFSDYYREISE